MTIIPSSVDYLTRRRIADNYFSSHENQASLQGRTLLTEFLPGFLHWRDVLTQGIDQWGLGE